MKVFVFLAEGFEEIEAIAPIDIFRRAGLNVTTVSVSEDLFVAGAHQIIVKSDVLFEKAVFDGDCFLFLPGGLPGTTNLDAHVGLKTLLAEQVAKNAPMAAICAAPSIFGKMGLLEGKEAICYPGFESALKGATLSADKMVKSGDILTAKAAGVAIPFALEIVALLKGQEIADSIREGIFL